jgi:hydrogenase maturation protease
MTAWRVFVAGVGNVFLGDDGFGVEVIRRLTEHGRALPAGVAVADVGIRGIHLAYELMDGCDLLVLVDTASTGAVPGTVAVLEPRLPDPAAAPPVLDAHGLAPDQLLATLAKLGVRPARTLVVGCEPADLTEGIGLSPPVQAAVPAAVRLVEELIEHEEGGHARAAGQGSGVRDRGGGGRPAAARHQAVPRDSADVRTG